MNVRNNFEQTAAHIMAGAVSIFYDEVYIIMIINYRKFTRADIAMCTKLCTSLQGELISECEEQL